MTESRCDTAEGEVCHGHSQDFQTVGMLQESWPASIGAAPDPFVATMDDIPQGSSSAHYCEGLSLLHGFKFDLANYPVALDFNLVP